MSVSKLSSSVARVALVLTVLLSVGAVTTLAAQQAQASETTVPAVATPAVQAPAASPLFASTDAAAPTIAAAEAASDAVTHEGSHTIVVSTLVLVLGIIILVLLID